MTTQNTPTGIDLIQTAKNIWQRKGFISIIVIISTLIGLSIRYFKTDKKLYTATYTSLIFQPIEIASNDHYQEKIGNYNIIQYIPIRSYPLIISSTPFIQKILTSNIQINDSLMPIYKWINPSINKFPTIHVTDSILQFNSIQQETVNILQKAISFNVDEISHIFTIKVSLEDPRIAASIAQKIGETFIKQINIIETQKQHEFIQFKEKQYKELTQELQNTTNVSQNLLQEQKELHKQLETLKQEVQYQCSSFHSVEPIIIPTIPQTTPTRSLLFFICVGFLVGIGLVLILPLIAEITESKYLSTWNLKKK